MMKKVFVKWDFTDEYGRAREAEAMFEWFETMEQANEFITEKRKGNGGYFILWKVEEGDYNEFLRMRELRKELEELKNKF
jgi:hypothetical protein